MKLIDKAAVVAEIKKHRTEWKYGSSIEAKYKKEECDDILSFLDTIEVKNSFTPLDSDFERDAVSFCIDKGLNTTPYIAKTIAKHFFNLGLMYDNTEIKHKK